jgi:hypothetical protein
MRQMIGLAHGIAVMLICNGAGDKVKAGFWEETSDLF